MGLAFEIVGKDFRKFWWGPQNCYLKEGLGGLVMEGIKCWQKPWFTEETFFYPEPNELRKRLATLEADPTPITEMNLHVQLGLAMLRDFVETYEEAFIGVTPWEPVYLWRRDDTGRNILRDADGNPLLQQEEPICRRRLPVIILSQ